jgi:hypothetical protein
MDSIELVTSSWIHRKLKYSCNWRSFCQLCRQMDDIFQEFYFCDSLKQSINSASVVLLETWFPPWFPIDKRITKESGKNWHRIRNIWSCPGRFQKLPWSRMGLHWDVDLVSFVEGESAYDFFNVLALREWNPILDKLDADTQYVLGFPSCLILNSVFNRSQIFRRPALFLTWPEGHQHRWKVELHL